MKKIVLISGYFLVFSQQKIQKILSLIGQVFFYSISIYTVAYLTGVITIDLKSLIKALFPISTKYLWFASVYFGFYLLCPFLNVSIRSMNKTQMKNSIIVMFIMFSVIPSLTIIYDPWNTAAGFSLLWFIFIYYVAAYIRIYSLYDYGNFRYLYLLFYFVCVLSLVASKYFLPEYFKALLGRHYLYSLIYGYNSVLVFMSSIFMFMFFLKIKIYSTAIRKILTFITPHLFGVYLYHNHPAIRDYIWKEVFSPLQYASSILIIPYFIFCVVSIFCFGILIDFLRSKIFARVKRSTAFHFIYVRISNVNFISELEKCFHSHDKIKRIY